MRVSRVVACAPCKIFVQILTQSRIERIHSPQRVTPRSGDLRPLENVPSQDSKTMLNRLENLGRKLPTEPNSNHPSIQGVPAAVIAPLVLPSWESDIDEAQLLFIKRSQDLRKHAGQMAFPGGVKEKSDRDLLAAGFREGKEEVGLRKEEVKMLATLPSASTPSGFNLQPYFVATTQQDYIAEPGEVDSIHIIPVKELLSCPVRLEEKIWQEQSYRVVYFDTESVCIWGVTGRILEVVLSHFFDWRAPNFE